MLLKKIIPLLLALFIVHSAVAQSKMPTSRILKTATSLMEAQRYEAAEEYFKKGLQQARAGNEPYNLAQAHEGLGNLYSKTNQPAQAIENYEKAEKMYRTQGLTVIAD